MSYQKRNSMIHHKLNFSTQEITKATNPTISEQLQAEWKEQWERECQASIFWTETTQETKDLQWCNLSRQIFH